MGVSFEARFTELTKNEPFPWQCELYRRMMAGDLPPSCELPTGLGKTSVITVWWLALEDGAPVPRRLVYVVNRRTVVDQTTNEVEFLRSELTKRPSAAGMPSLAISTLRGQMADNRAWSADPSCPAVICGTVDMIGSRLLFSGYRVGYRGRPLHAGFLGQDALLVHDEAHLEPAFQVLVERICDEQARGRDPWPLRLIALTATPRDGGARVLRLSDDDLAHPVVAQRFRAPKKLTLHVSGDRDLVDRVVAQVLTYQHGGRAILVFLRTVEDVARAVAQLRKAGVATQLLTGTLRGLERDQLLASDPILQRFLPADRNSDVVPAKGTVVLVATSAGEVGVNLSAVHCVSDLSTFDSMAQRFGRVNRFGDFSDSEVHVFHPPPEVLLAKKVTKVTEDASSAEETEPDDGGALSTDTTDADSLDMRRLATLALLRQLDGAASPRALSGLDPAARVAAFAPPPQIQPATSILFDAWAMTTLREVQPGRPPVSAYLHGVAEWEPPRTQVAWRDEVELVVGDLLKRYRPRDLLEDYPLKPHELLSERSTRVAEVLQELADKKAAATAPVWLIDELGAVGVSTIGGLATGDANAVATRLASCTLLLPARLCGPVEGLLSADGWRKGNPPPAVATNGATPALVEHEDVAEAAPDETAARGRSASADVADEWQDESGQPQRARRFDGEPPPPGMRLIRTLMLRDDEDGEEEDENDEHVSGRAPRRWSWYEQPRGADDEGSRGGRRPVLLSVHSADVEAIARQIVSRLALPPGLQRAVVLAAKHHDHGKNRRVWQRGIGNHDPTLLLAKAGASKEPLDISTYRHELGSALDAERELLAELEPDERDLALHLIAAHHGRARPSFPADELIDPEARGVDLDEEGLRVVQRFARLQRRFGRWGLAYLESLVRAADYAASAHPSAEVTS